MKKILIPLLVLAFIGAGIGFYMYNKPVESLEKKKADVTVTADQLLADYESNEAQADDKYLGKVVEVSGKVAEVSSPEGINKVHLETPNPISVVISELDKGNSLEGLEVGDVATIKGLCTGYLDPDIILVS